MQFSYFIDNHQCVLSTAIDLEEEWELYVLNLRLVGLLCICVVQKILICILFFGCPWQNFWLVHFSCQALLFGHTGLLRGSSLVSGSPSLRWGCPSVSVSISPRLCCCRLIQWVCRLMTVSLFPCLKESLLLEVDDYYCCNVRKILSLCWKSIAIWYKWHLFFLWKRDALECVCTQPLRMASWSINLTLSSVTSNVTGQLQGDWSLLSHSVSCSIGEMAPFPLSSSV